MQDSVEGLFFYLCTQDLFIPHNVSLTLTNPMQLNITCKELLEIKKERIIHLFKQAQDMKNNFP